MKRSGGRRWQVGMAVMSFALVATACGGSSGDPSTEDASTPIDEASEPEPTTTVGDDPPAEPASSSTTTVTPPSESLDEGATPPTPELAGQPAGGGRTDAIRAQWVGDGFVAYRGLRYDAGHIIELWRSDDGATWTGPSNPELPGGQILRSIWVDDALVLEVVGDGFSSGESSGSWAMRSADLETWTAVEVGFGDIEVVDGLIPSTRVHAAGSSGFFYEWVGADVDRTRYPGQLTFQTGDGTAFEFREDGGDLVRLPLPAEILERQWDPLVWRLDAAGEPQLVDIGIPATPVEGDETGVIAVDLAPGASGPVWFGESGEDWRELDLGGLIAPGATRLWPLYAAGNLYMTEPTENGYRIHASADLGATWTTSEFDDIDHSGSSTVPHFASGPAGVAFAVGAPAPTIVFAADGLVFERLVDPGPGENTRRSAISTFTVGDDEVLYSISRTVLPNRIPTG